jgi:hypothetical protein
MKFGLRARSTPENSLAPWRLKKLNSTLSKLPAA